MASLKLAEVVEHCDDQFAGRWWGRFENCWEIWQGQSHVSLFLTQPRSLVCVSVFCINSCHYVSIHFPTTLPVLWELHSSWRGGLWFIWSFRTWVLVWINTQAQHDHIPCSWLLISHIYFHWNREDDTLLEYWGQGFGFWLCTGLEIFLGIYVNIEQEAADLISFICHFKRCSSFFLFLVSPLYSSSVLTTLL